MEHYYKLKLICSDYIYIKTNYILKDLMILIENKSVIKVEIVVSSHESKQLIINTQHIIYVENEEGNPHLS